METPIGFIPETGELQDEGMGLSDKALRELLAIDAEEWRKEYEAIADYFTEYGDRLPERLKEAHGRIVEDLEKSG